jgi:hypothetical protein
MSAHLNMTQIAPHLNTQNTRKALVGILFALVVAALLGTWAWRASNRTPNPTAIAAGSQLGDLPVNVSRSTASGVFKLT